LRGVPNGTQRVSAEHQHPPRSFLRIAIIIAIALLIDGAAVSLSPHPVLASEIPSAPVAASTSPVLASTAGHLTATSNPVVAQAVRPQNAMYPEGSSRFTWSGKWSSTAYKGYSGGKARYSKAKGAAATFRFSGTRVSWVGPVGPTRGSARVYVDGKLVKTVSTFSSRFVARRTLFTRSWSTQGSHTLKIVVLGTAHHPTVAIDAIAVAAS
jgi:hypothetical protein